jgi:hypothetical protein
MPRLFSAAAMQRVLRTPAALYMPHDRQHVRREVVGGLAVGGLPHLLQTKSRIGTNSGRISMTTGTMLITQELRARPIASPETLWRTYCRRLPMPQWPQTGLCARRGQAKARL